MAAGGENRWPLTTGAYEDYYGAAEAPDGSIWLDCAGQPGTGDQGKQIFRSLDGGRHFELRREAPSLKRDRVGSGIDSGGYLYYLAPASASTAYAFVYRAGLARTDDGGRHWHDLHPFEQGDDTGLINSAVAGNGATVWQTVLNISTFASTDIRSASIRAGGIGPKNAERR